MDARGAVEQLRAAVGALLGSSLSSGTDDDLLAVGREVEILRRQLEGFDQVLVAEVERRSLPARHLVPSTAGMLALVWHVAPAEARRRVGHVRELGPRATLTGQTLPPLRPTLGAARAEGAISSEHVQVILRALHRLPAALPAGTVDKAETILTDTARSLAPPELAKAAVRLVDTLDPDGRLAAEDDHRRRRSLTLTPLPGGMHRLAGDLDPTCAALAATVLNSLAAPRPADSDGHDLRTPGQRRHDALSSVLKFALRAGELPASGGTPATVLITMTSTQVHDQTGIAETTFGQQLSVRDALRLADQASLAVLTADPTGRPLNLHRTRRIASPAQTLALIARDRGCTFPGCTMPPEWTERHHVLAWADGGATDLDNLTLLCDYHHDNHLRAGWTISMRDGQPWYHPPTWKDPERRPVRHHRFDSQPALAGHASPHVDRAPSDRAAPPNARTSAKYAAPPKVGTPAVRAPEVAMPEAGTPAVRAAEVRAPKVRAAPEVPAPKVRASADCAAPDRGRIRAPSAPDG